MKKFSVILLAFAVLLLTNVSAAPIARATAGSFAFQYSFDPKITGDKGGDVKLTLEVTNTKTGTKEINWVEIKVNTAETYKQKWPDMHLLPQHDVTFNTTVPFGAADVNKAKKLTISVGTNEGIDEVKSISFTIKGTQDVLHTGLSISKTGQIYTGDKVKFKFTYKNEMKAGTIKNLKVYASLIRDGVRIAKTDTENLGDVAPGDTVNQTLTYTFKDADTGDVDVNCHVSYSFLDCDYTAGSKLKIVNVEKQAATEPPSPTATETPSPTATETLSPTVSPSPSAVASVSPSAISPAPDSVQATSGSGADPNTWLYVVIAAAGVIVTAVTAVVARKKRLSKKE